MSTAAQLASVLEAGGPGLAGSLAAPRRGWRRSRRDQGAELGGHATGTLDGGRQAAAAGAGVPLRGSGPRPGGGAVAVELLHMATLVHDDVLDQAPLRRGRPTVFATGGRAAATATGDLLFSRAFAELAATGSERRRPRLSRASSALARGELMQRADAWSDEVTTERYLERCELKTASLFAAACRLGALLGEPPARRRRLAGFGRRIGLAFQILDDVLDVSGPSERTGKHRGTDLLDGTVTLPLIVARERDPELAALDLRELVSRARAGGGGVRPDRDDRRPGRGRERGAEPRGRGEGGAGGPGGLPASRRRALDLVADGVVERYA